MTTQLRAAAAALRPGDKLPSTRALSAEHGAGPVTIGRAIARLVTEGVVVTAPGRGSFVAHRASATSSDVGWQTVALGQARVQDHGLAQLLAAPSPGSLTLSSGYLSDDLQPLRALVAATTRAARRPSVWGQVPPAGLPELRAVLAGPLHVDPAEVLVVPGGQAGLSTALRALTPAGSPVLVEVPTYLGALAAARSAGLYPVPVPTDHDGLRPDLLARAFDLSGARLLYTQPTYANPTGTVLSPDRRTALLEVAAAAGAFVIEDDWARHLGLDGTTPPPLVRNDPHGHVVHIGSLTKTTAPSLRIGALVARGPALERLLALRTVDDFFVSRPLQEAAVELLVSPAWPRHLTALRAALRSRRDALLAAVRSHLPDGSVTRVPPGGLHLWLRLPPGTDDVDISERARRIGVVVSPGRPYFVTEPPGPHLRLTYAAATEPDLTEGVRRLGDLLR